MILSIDTCLQRCAVALVGTEVQAGADTSFVASIDMQQGHASHLAPMVRDVMHRAQIDLHDITAIGVTIGPGGFTGLRVGLSFARAFVIGTQIPVIGVTTLEALAVSAAAKRDDIVGDVKIASLVDARRKKLYTQIFHFGQNGRVNAITDAADMGYADAAALIAAHQPSYIAGNGAALLSDMDDLQTICTQIDTMAVAQITQDRLDKMGRNTRETTKPTALYLRDADAIPAKPLLSFATDVIKDKEACQ